MGGSDDVLESVLGLGDLADLTVTNDETDYSYDVRHEPKRSFSTRTLVDPSDHVFCRLSIPDAVQ